MIELSSILANATLNVSKSYFHLEIDGGDSIYRERVYCYELYHQMRLIWPKNTEYYLNGEIDKAAHPILRTLGASFFKPDLLIHKPGYMSGNQVIIEVKTKNVTTGGLRKDLKSLTIFMNHVGYQRGIYLIYGYDIDPQNMLERILSAANEIENLSKIEIWFHLHDGNPAFHFYTLYN